MPAEARGLDDARSASGPRRSGLAPVWRADARVLILGSFPGELSLSQARYYAHPRNQFWPVMQHLFGLPAHAGNDERLEHLKRARIALWDVLGACRRKGSLDADIRDREPNDFRALLASMPGLQRIVFNGATAAALFERHVVPTLTPPQAQLSRARLPSTSPAHAGMSFEDKLGLWRDAVSAVTSSAPGATLARP